MRRGDTSRASSCMPSPVVADPMLLDMYMHFLQEEMQSRAIAIVTPNAL